MIPFEQLVALVKSVITGGGGGAAGGSPPLAMLMGSLGSFAGAGSGPGAGALAATTASTTNNNVAALPEIDPSLASTTNVSQQQQAGRQTRRGRRHQLKRH